MRIGSYKLIELLGEGGLGQVWRVRHDLFPERDLALKIMRPRFAQDELKRAAFTNEIRAMARVEHPGIVKIFDASSIEEEKGSISLDATFPSAGPYFVMEMASSGALSQHTLSLGLDALLALIFACLDVLSHSHARGVIHRDIKPANILLGWGEGGCAIKLTDFGLSNVRGEKDPSLGWGTPDYMAPEQLGGRWREQGPWTDLFALGSMIHELVTGTLPYTLDDLSGLPQIEGTRAHSPSRIDGFRGPLFAWLERMIAKNPYARFSCAADAAWTLARAAELDSPLGWDAANALLRWALTSPSSPPPADARRHIATTLPREQDAPHTSDALPPLPSRELLETASPECPERWIERTDQERPSPLLAPRIQHLRESSLVGRARERDLLWEILYETWRTHRTTPKVILLEGERGVGKSHLAKWFANHSQELGLVTHLAVGYSDPIGPFDGLIPALAEMLGVQDLSAPAIRRALDQNPRGLTFEDALAREQVVRLLQPSHTTHATEELSHLDRYDVMASLLEQSSAHKPLIITIENVHLGAEILFFIRHLNRNPSLSTRALFVLMARQEELAGRELERALLDEIRLAPNAQRVQVEPLSRAALEYHLEHNYPLEPSFLDHLLVRDDLDPSQVIAHLEALSSESELVQSANGWRLSKGYTASDETRQRWSRRLERFLERDRSTQLSLEVMAALGLESSRHEWMRVCTRLGASCTPHSLERISFFGLLRGHDARRLELASEELRVELERRSRDAGRWRAIHMCVANILSNDEPERRARHFLAANLASAAIEDLTHAATRRLERGELLLTHELLDRIEEVLLEVGDGGGREHAIFSTRARALRADCFDLQGRYLEAHEVAAEVVASANELGMSEIAARAFARQAFATLHSGATEEAYLNFMHLSGGHARRSPRAKLMAYEGLARVAQRRGDLAGARELFTRCLEEARSLGMDHIEAVCLNGLGDIARQANELDAARDFSQRALLLFERRGHRVMVADCLNDLAELARLEGDYDHAMELCQRSIAIFESVDSRMSHRARLELAYVSLGQSEFDRARVLLERLCLTFYQEKDFGQLALAVVGMLPILAGRGDIERLGQAIEHARQLLAQTERRDRDVAFALELARHIDLELLEPAQREALLELRAEHTPEDAPELLPEVTH